MARSLTGFMSGTKRYMSNIIRALLATDLKNEYVIYYDQESCLGDNPSAMEKVIKMPTKLLWDHIALPLAAKKDGIDVLFCPKNVVPPLSNCKSVITVHDLGYMVNPTYYPPIDTLYMNMAIRWSVRKSSAIIAVSQNTKIDLVSRLRVKAEKIYCIYESMNEDYIPIKDRARLEDVRDKYNLPSEFFLSLAGLQRRKNLPNLIKAFSLAKERSEINHKLVMVGAASWQHSTILNEVEASPVKDEIMWLKFVAEEDLPAIYNLATALIFPSLYEGFGLPLLEAMACGCPVVCSNTSSLPEIAGGAAILVDPTNVEQLADGIYRVITEDKLRNSLTKKGLKRASYFSWQRAARETLEVFEEVYRK